MIPKELYHISSKVNASEEIRLSKNEYIQRLSNSDDIEHQLYAKKIIEIAMYEVSRAQNRKMFSEKTRYINHPVNANGYTIYANTITQNGKMFPYILAYHQNMREGSEILVDTLNTRDSESTKNREDVFIAGADKVGSYIRSGADIPILYIFCPKEDFLNEPYYQQLSRECFTASDREYDRCDLLVKESIQDAQKKLRSLSGKEVSDKIVLGGYSTSGVFAQRFAMIHPEMISKAIIGGAAGSIPIPTEDLEYPLGIKDFEKLFGKNFDEESYRKIEFAYYVGELEAKEESNRRDENGNIVPMHDMAYLTKSILEDIGTQYRSMFGENLHERFANAVNWYKENGYKIISKIYKGAAHTSLTKKNYMYASNHFKDLLTFYRDGINGDGFKKDESSVDRIIMFTKDGKSGFDDCMQDDKVRTSTEQEATNVVIETVRGKEKVFNETEQKK